MSGVATLFTVVLSGRRLFPRRRRVRPVPRRVAVGRSLVRPVVGTAHHDGERVQQVDRVTCGPTVMVAIRCSIDEAYGADLLDSPGFGERLAQAQWRAHREANRLWPRRFGTTPWGMRRWLRRHGAGRYRVRLVDASYGRDLTFALSEVGAALDAGWPVPVLIGSTVPRHWVLALRANSERLLVFEPTRGAVRAVPREAVTGRGLGPLLGYDDIEAVLLPRFSRRSPRAGS